MLANKVMMAIWLMAARLLTEPCNVWSAAFPATLKHPKEARYPAHIAACQGQHYMPE